jgi:lysozyme family protein
LTFHSHAQKRAAPQAGASVDGGIEYAAAAAAERLEADLEFDRELAMRVARARQTTDYAAVQRGRFSQLRIAKMTIWDALELLDEVSRCAPHSAEPALLCNAESQDIAEMHCPVSLCLLTAKTRIIYAQLL